jgi:hypothetical protein
MNNDEIINGFKKEFLLLIENVKKGVGKISDGSRLNSILSEIKIEPDEISMACKECGHKKYSAVLSLLTKEMEFLNSIHAENEWKKWLKAVDVVLESIGKYFNHPMVDIFREVVRIASIFSKPSKAKKE